MIRIQRDGFEIALTYDEFIREVREGKITPETPVQSDVLTLGEWKQAGQLQFFRSWAPTANQPPDFPPLVPPTDTTRVPADGPPMGGHGGPGGLPRNPAIPGWDPGQPSELLPWEEIEQIGLARAFPRTIRLALSKMDVFARGISAGESVMPALVFGLLVHAIARVFDALYAVGTMKVAGPMLEQMTSSMSGLFGPDGPPKMRDVIFQYGILILFYPALIFIWAGVVHLLLRLFGKPQKGFAGTLRVANYAMAPHILAVLPVCGNIVGGVWAIVLMARSLMIVHRTGGMGAAAAVILPMIGVCLWMLLPGFLSMIHAIPGAAGGS
jgi:hypothetical protein